MSASTNKKSILTERDHCKTESDVSQTTKP